MHSHMSTKTAFKRWKSVWQCCQDQGWSRSSYVGKALTCVNSVKQSKECDVCSLFLFRKGLISLIY